VTSSPSDAQCNAADRRADLLQLVLETDTLQQPRSICVDRDPGSDLPQNLGLLEHGYVDASRPKCERSGETPDTAADDCNMK
jgi:hypothetical protein